MPTLTIGAAGIALIKQFEGCARKRADGRFDAYPDPATGGAPWTIGWGTTGRDIAKGVIWTQAQCDARLAREAAMFAAGVVHLLNGAKTTQNQFDALVCFAYNVGLDDDHDGIAEGLGDSTLLRKHKAGDYVGAAAEFAKWNKADGKIMPGLTKRRSAEADLYGRAS